MGELCGCVMANDGGLLSNSDWIAIMALMFSIISFVISQLISMYRVKKEKEVSNVRYNEQKKQYEKRLAEEREQYNEQRKYAEKVARVSEQPYLVYKSSEIIKTTKDNKIIFCIKFLNKGRGSAYSIIPEMECTAKKQDMSEVQIYRYAPVQDPIASVGEYFETDWCYISENKEFFNMITSIFYEDSSGRKYKQTYNLDIYESGEGIIKNYSKPEQCD